MTENKFQPDIMESDMEEKRNEKWKQQSRQTYRQMHI